MTRINLSGRLPLLDLCRQNFAAGGLRGGPPMQMWPATLAPQPLGLAPPIYQGMQPFCCDRASDGHWWSGLGGDATAFPGLGHPLCGATLDWTSGPTIDCILQATPPGTILSAKFAARPYIGGAWNSYPNAFLYGYVEMMARMPKCPGAWPSLSLYPVNRAPQVEADVFECPPVQPGQYLATLHSADADWLKARGAAPGANGASITVKTPDLSLSFNAFGMDWQPRTTSFFFNGDFVGAMATPPDMCVPMYLVAAMGGGLAGSWAGAIDPSSLPARMEVSHLRAWGP